MKKNIRGFTLLEMVITVGIIGFISVALWGSVKFFNVTGKKNRNKTISLQKAQKAMDYIKKDFMFSLGIDTTYLPSISGYANTTTSICLKMPTVDDNGAVIADTVDEYVDYLYYYLDGTELKCETIVCPVPPNADLAPAPIGRVSGVQTIARNVQSISFKADFYGTGTMKDFNTYYAETGYNDLTYNTALKDQFIVEITITTQATGVFTSEATSSITTRLKFWNKEFASA